ncbi:MAG: ABC transporter permease [Roseivirga sp.]
MKEEWSNPPKWPGRMLGWFCSEEHLEILQGDLYELYEYRLEHKGKFLARLHYIKDAFDMLRPFARKKRKEKLRNNTITMFRNHIKVGWRNIVRYKGYSTINIMGLALGLACCMILFRYVKDELSYDRFHDNAGDIYRIVYSTNEDNSPSNANGSLGPGVAIARDFPEVTHAARLMKTGSGGRTVVSYNEKRFYEGQFFFADSSILNVFTFPLIQGDPRTALREPNSVIITESTSEKYFGDESPMGKFIDAYPGDDGEKMQLMVTGVAKDVPSNSHFHFDFLASFHSQKGDWTGSWGGFWQVFSYVKLNPSASAAALSEKLPEFTAKYMGENPWYSLSLQPLLDIHLNSDLKSEIEPTSSVTKVYVFSAVGFLILIIACINFLTLSTAKSARRASEVGVRKTFGAYRSQLFGQFISEAMLHGVLATALAVGLTSLALPFVNDLTDKSLSLIINGNWFELAGIILGAILVVTFLAGLYPAIFLSSFKPIVALRAVLSGQGSISKLRRFLVVFQFTISIALVVGSLVVSQQMSLISEKSMAQSGDQLMVLQLNKEIRSSLSAFETLVKQSPSVYSVSGVSRVPTRGSETACINYGEEKRGCAYIYLTDFDYPEAMDFKLLAGRFFDRSIASDSVGGFVVSESSLAEFELGSPDEAIGKEFAKEYYPNGRVIGVVEDFHVYSLHRELSPAIMVLAPKEAYNFMAIRVSPKDVSRTLEQVGSAWSRFSTAAPFDYFFMDEAFERLHQEDIRTGKVVSVLTILAILIAAIGLFGLASFMSEQRSKEIGIRKVLGASVSSILVLMSRSYVVLILISSVLGIPLSYWLMTKWLEGFVYRAEFNPLVFVLAILSVGFIVVFSIGYQSLRAARANPVKSLRNE